jgi:hypothetical protein
MSAGKLVHKETGEELVIGACLNWDGIEYELRGWRRPHKSSSSGRVFVVRADNPNGFEKSLFPHVFDLEIVDYE